MVMNNPFLNRTLRTCLVDSQAKGMLTRHKFQIHDAKKKNVVKVMGGYRMSSRGQLFQDLARLPDAKIPYNI